ncbi:MAG: T9SS type A sorting domain-containing protein, partial [Cyclobacteriaceae bacterium]
FNLCAQDYYPVTDINVTKDGKLLSNGFAGGMSAPQFGKIDVDFDGTDEMVVFDRFNDRLMVFVLSGGDYVYTPQMTSYFPTGLDNWVLFRDFNHDGRKDLFASTPLGMELYVNTGNIEDGLTWRKYHDREPAQSPILTQGFNSLINLQLNATDIPAIDDIDNDGDTDILVFRFAGGSTVEWHRNFSIERTGSADSLQLERVTSAWGGFRECICGTFAFNNEQCPPVSGRPMHEGGKTLLTIDLDGDGDRDAMVSEETCDNIFALRNDGSPADAEFSTVITNNFEGLQPFFPAAYYEDINNDGFRDLVISSNWPSAREDYLERVNYYLNIGTDEIPEFEIVNNRFAIGSMIDGGSLSHPAFYDIDGNGKPDLILGTYKNENFDSPWARLEVYLNNGEIGDADFQFSVTDFLSLSEQKFLQIRPGFADIDNDGITDLYFTALKAGLGHRLYLIKGSGNREDPFPGSPIQIFNELGEQDVVSLFDEDSDGTVDLLVGRVTGNMDLYRGAVSGGSVFFNFESSGAFGLVSDGFRGATFLISANVDGTGAADLLRADSRGGLAWLESADETGEWQMLSVYTDSERSGLHNPGRNLAPVAVDLLGLSQEQIVLGSGSGGVQILRPANADVIPPGDNRSLILYPNPVFNGKILNIRSSEPARYRITDMSGRIIRNFPEAGKTSQISTENLSSGMYILSADYNDGMRISKRFIVFR